MRQLELTIKDKQKKIYKKNHLLMWILAVIGRYGSHLKIVMIFVTQNNFLNGEGISDRLLGFYQFFFFFFFLSSSNVCYAFVLLYVFIYFNI